MKKRVGEEGDAGQAAGASQAKQARLSNSQSGSERPWDIRAGMILEVNLRNFMCHETFSYKPNQRLNFLCGVNGSGKSAVLTAIVFGLGGTARMASRGSSNKGFIRTGQSSATVEIRLCNQGEDRYRPEIYGNSIVVVRTVTNSSSTYKLKDHKGKIACEKKVKEELDRILLNFNIQVENPIAVLNQDTAKTFLFKCDPDKLYTFFMRATQLESCKNDYNSAAVEKGQAEAHLEEKKASMPELTKELEKWRKKYDFHQNLKHRKQDLKEKKAEFGWARVRDGETEVEEQQNKLDVVQKKIPMCDKNIEDVVSKEKEVRAEKRNLEAEIQDIGKNQDAEEAELTKLKTHLKIKAEALKNARRAVKEFESNKLSKEADMKTVEETIENMRSGEGQLVYEERRSKRHSKMEQLYREVDALTAQAETSTNHAKHLRSNHRDVEFRLNELKGEVTKERGAVNRSKEQLKVMKEAGEDKLAAFGNWMPRVIAEINRSRKFSKKPIGPLGVHVKIRENVSKDLAKAVEIEIGGLLNSFLCDNNADQRELFNIFGTLKLPHKPPIFTCSFTSQKHDVSRDCVRSEEYTTLLDCLDIADPNVYNRIVDSCSLERILFIPSAQEAQQVLGDVNTVPRNLLHANVANTHQYYPAPNYRAYFREDRSRGVLKADMAELIKQIEEQLRQEENKVAELEMAIRDTNDEKTNNNRLIDAEESKVRKINTRLCDLNTKHRNLKAEDANDNPPDVAEFVADLEKFRNEIDDIDVKKAAAEEASRNAQETAIEAKRAYEKAEEETKSSRENIDPLNDRLSKLENALKKSKRDKDHFLAKNEEYKKSVGEFEATLNEKLSALEEVKIKASMWSEERIETRRKVESLAKEIMKIEESLKRQEETQEPRELVMQKYESLTNICGRAQSQVKYMEKTVNYLGDMLHRRKLGFKVILSTTCKNINRNFTLQLNARNYLGKLEFDHKEHTLSIIVNPDSNSQAAALDINRDIRTLSGGEKSYSSVSLILALWNAMNPPFRVLDEFDVFMDAVNRRISLENIINYARDDRKYQFIFLTPLNTDNIEVGEDLKIIKLAKRAG